MRCILLLVISLFFSFPASAHSWLKITIATSEYPPYTSTEMKHDGFINHIVTEAFQKVGVTVEYVSLPWSDIISPQAATKYDAISYAYFNRERTQHFYHSDPVSTQNLVFFARKALGINHWQSFTDLDEYRVARTESYTYTGEVLSFIQQLENRSSTEETDLKNLEKLISNDVDIFPIDELTGWYLLNRYFSDVEREQITMLTPYISTNTAHLLFPKSNNNSQMLLHLFNYGLAKLAMDGKMEHFKTLLRDGFYQHPEPPTFPDRR